MMRTRAAQLNALKMLLPCLAVLGGADRAGAVITLQSEARNTTPSAEILPAWNLQGQFLIFNATPISPSHFVTARHIGGGVGNQITYGTQAYTTDGFTDIAGTDLRVWHINTQGGTRTFPTWAPIWNPSVDGTEVGKSLTVFGRGVPRAEAVYAPIYPGTSVGSVPNPSITPTGGGASLGGPAPSGQGDLRGWKWGAVDGVASWGQNKVEFTLADPDFGQLIGFNFDSGSAAVANEAILARNDSSGGVFAQNAAGQWKLIGVNLGVDGAWSFTPGGPYFDGAIFDARGLYVGSATSNQLVPQNTDPIAASSYSTRVSSYYSQLSTITGGFAGLSGGGNVVPEPTSALALLAATALTRRRSRR
jgi:hypothetical protein